MTVMKKYAFYLLGISAIISSCAKEVADNSVEPQNNENRTYRIVASINESTKTTVTDAGVFAWADDEIVGVADGTTTRKNFTIDNAQKTDGVFTYTGGDVSGELRYAVSPNTAMVIPSTTGNDVTINLSSSYSWEAGKTNALMIAGAPTINGDEYKFTFHHAMALLKFTVVNVPVGTKTFRVTTDQNISNAQVTVDATSNPTISVSDLTGSPLKYVDIVRTKAVTDKNTTVTFYAPVPAGTYKTFRVDLLNVGGTVLATKSKTISGVTLAKADVFATPNITLSAAAATDSYTLVTDLYDMVDGQYVILAKKTSDATAYSYMNSTTASSARPAVGSQDIFNGTSNPSPTSAVTDEMLFTFTGGGDEWFIQNSEGKFLYTTNSNNGTRINNTEDIWTVSVHPGNANAFALQEDNNSRFVGIFSGNDVWNTYTEVDHANFGAGATSQIVLYYRGTLSAKPRLSTPTNVYAELNTSDAEVTNAIDIIWDDPNSVGSVSGYEIRLVPTAGATVVTTSATTSVSVENLAYSTEYEISVRALSADYTTMKDSEWTTPDSDATVTTGAKPSGAEDPKTYTITFETSANMSAYTNAYTSSFNYTYGGLTLTLQNINNGTAGSPWSVLRAGQQKNASTAIITTGQIADYSIKTVTIRATQATQTTSAKLYVSSSSTFTTSDEYNFSAISGAGTATATVSTPAKNKYYKIEISIAKGANGSYRFDQLTYSNQ